jgi:hypothetical protein
MMPPELDHVSEHQAGSSVDEQRDETRQERRARKLESRRERMQKHGASLRQIYTNAVLKRVRRATKKTDDR